VLVAGNSVVLTSETASPTAVPRLPSLVRGLWATERMLPPDLQVQAGELQVRY